MAAKGATEGMAAVHTSLIMFVLCVALGSSAVGAQPAGADPPAAARTSATSDIEAGRIPPFWQGLDARLNDIRRQGVTVIIRRGGVTEEDRERLAEAQAVTGAARVEPLLVSGRFNAAAFLFDRYAPMTELIEQAPECIYAGGGVVIVPRQAADDNWVRLADAARAIGGFRHSEETARRKTLLVMLGSQMEVWRYLIDAHRAVHETDPPLEALSWELLASVDPDLAGYRPTNAFVSDGVSQVIAVVDGERQHPDRVKPTQAGWVWNARARQLTPVGVSCQEIHRALVDTKHMNRTLFIEWRANLALRRLESLRLAIRSFTAMNDAPPDFDGAGWRPLIEGGFLPEPVANPMLPIPNALRIAVIEIPGAEGDLVAMDDAGWVWNATDQRLYAAGFTDDELEETASDAPRPRPLFTRQRLAEQQAEGMTAAIRQARRFERRAEGEAAPPLDALRRPGGPLENPPRNPFNGLATIQTATWSAEDPPTDDETGWNYDPAAGVIWPNTTDMRTVAERVADR
jgi:hypothetical protein